jgi:hypothetical protein
VCPETSYIKTIRVLLYWRKMVSDPPARGPEQSTSDIFLITDQVEKGHVEIKYCPTNMMIGDFFTKPLQGKKFEFFEI